MRPDLLQALPMTVHTLNLVLLGIGVGFLAIVPPGPITVSLLHVGARLGRRPAMRGALGVASGDLVLVIAAVVIVGGGSALPAAAFTTMQIISAITLVALGALLLLRPSAADATIGRIQRPGRTFFLLTSFTPSALGAWVAVLAAMPFAGDRHELAPFAVGAVIASMLWHPVLGALASTIGPRLSVRHHLRLAQTGGLCMTAFGAGLAAQHLL